MIKCMIFGIILYNMCSTIVTIQLHDAGVCVDPNGTLSCCFNYRLHNGICVACSIGYLMEDDVCVPCRMNTYGDQCLLKCSCNYDQRCHHALGCVDASTNMQLETTFKTIWSTDKVDYENVTQTRATLLTTVEEQKITKPTTTKNNNYGILDREIVIYSVVAACLLVILGLSYLVFKYKQKTVKKIDISNTIENTHSNRRHSLNNSNHSIYDEIDENMIVENININMMHINNSSFNDETHKNTDNTSYLHVIHSEDKSSSTSISVKSVNNSYLSFLESDQNTHSDQSQRDDDTTSYLHPYHTVDEDWKEKTHQYDITHVSNKDTDDSSDSSTQMISNGYLNPYQPLKDDWKHLSHSYEAPVTVHQCQQSLLMPFPSKKETKGIKNIYKDERQTVEGEHDIYPSRSFMDKTELSEICHQSISMQNSPDKIKLKQPIYNDYIVGIMTSSKHKQLGAFDVTDAISISPNKKIQDISESTNNNRWIIPNNLKSKSTSL